MASTLNNAAWVEWMTKLMGGVSRQTLTAALPPDWDELAFLPVTLPPTASRLSVWAPNCATKRNIKGIVIPDACHRLSIWAKVSKEQARAMCQGMSAVCCEISCLTR